MQRKKKDEIFSALQQSTVMHISVMQLQNIHLAFKFKQFSWRQTFIDFSTEQ